MRSFRFLHLSSMLLFFLAEVLFCCSIWFVAVYYWIYLYITGRLSMNPSIHHYNKMCSFWVKSCFFYLENLYLHAPFSSPRARTMLVNNETVCGFMRWNHCRNMRHAVVKGSGIFDNVVFFNVYWHRRMLFRLSGFLFFRVIFFPLSIYQQTDVHPLLIAQHSGLKRRLPWQIKIAFFYCETLTIKLFLFNCYVNITSIKN